MHAELVSTVRVVSLSWHKMEQPAGGSTQGKRAERTEGSIRFGCTFTTVTVEGATTMQASTTTFRARACAPAGLTARRARTHRVKAFTAPRTRTVAARPVVVVRAADGASPRRSPVVMAKKGTRPRRRSVRTRAAIHPSSTFADARTPPASHAGEGEEAPAEPEVRRDPIFGFESRGEPDKIQPGFDTAEGGKVGPVGTFFISLLLIVLFGASFFFTSVPRDAIKGMVDLSDDPNAPTDVFK